MPERGMLLERHATLTHEDDSPGKPIR
eukprot:COSAG02_NODE_70923_length_193_cov_32.212766_1_plen_26_part_10